MEGIPVSDQKLKEQFGDKKPEGLILPGIEASENVKAFIALPPKFKVYGDLDQEEAEADREQAAVKQRMSRLEDKGQHVSKEQRLERRHQDLGGRGAQSHGIIPEHAAPEWV